MALVPPVGRLSDWAHSPHNTGRMMCSEPVLTDDTTDITSQHMEKKKDGQQPAIAAKTPKLRCRLS